MDQNGPVTPPDPRFRPDWAFIHPGTQVIPNPPEALGEPGGNESAETPRKLPARLVIPTCQLSTLGFLSPDVYYAIPRNPRNIVFAKHNRLISQHIIHYIP
jgi:hypothetical protein